MVRHVVCFTFFMFSMLIMVASVVEASDSIFDPDSFFLTIYRRLWGATTLVRGNVRQHTSWLHLQWRLWQSLYLERHNSATIKNEHMCVSSTINTQRLWFQWDFQPICPRNPISTGHNDTRSTDRERQRYRISEKNVQPFRFQLRHNSAYHNPGRKRRYLFLVLSPWL